MERLKELFEDLYNLTEIKDIVYHKIQDGRLCPFYKRGSDKLSMQQWKNKHAENPVYVDGDPILERVINCEVIIINDIKNSQGMSPAFEIFDLESLIIVPLVVEGYVEGFIELASIGEKHMFVEEEVEDILELVYAFHNE